MKSFEKSNKVRLSSKPQKCIHGRRSLRYLTIKQNQISDPVACTQTIHDNEPSPTLSKQQKSYFKAMRSLIALNEDYFQHKLQVSSDCQPNRLKLKIPSQTGFTTYKKDFVRSQSTDQNQLALTQNFKEKKQKIDFFAETTYGNQFKGQQNQEKTGLIKHESTMNVDAPTFNESQYKHNYLNWGIGSHMPSMKPQPTPTTTNLAFHPSTVYSSEFKAKIHKTQQNFKLNNSSSLSINCKNISSPLLYMTTNKVFYDVKSQSKEKNLKPKTHTLAIDGGSLKGKTEYQTQFLKQKQGKKSYEKLTRKPLGELQTLIMNL